jgi:hypothetical protein
VGHEVDAAHPAVKKWLAAVPAEPTPDRHREPDSTVPTREDFAKLTFEKRQEETRRLRSRNDRDDGRLLSRQLVNQFVISAFDTLFRRFLEVSPRTLSAQIPASIRAGASREQIQAQIRDEHSSHLRATKQRVSRMLRGDALVAGDDPPAIPDQPPPEPETRPLRALATSLQERLRQDAAPKIADRVLRSVARVAGEGGRFEPAQFERVLAAAETVTPDATQHAATILDAHVVDALQRTIQALYDARTNEELASHD